MEPTTHPTVAPLRDALTSAHALLEAEVVGEVLGLMSSAELAEIMTLADGVASRAGALLIRTTAEAAHRGEFTSARRGEGSAHSWVREHAPSLRQAGAGQVAQLAQQAAASVPAGQWSRGGPDAGDFHDPDKPEGIVWSRVITGEVSAALALTTLREIARLVDVLRPAAVPTVTEAILAHGVQWGIQEAKKVRPHLLARFGVDGELEDQHRRLRPGACLSSPQILDGDLTDYRLSLTPEQAAILEAAIGPLSRPSPPDEAGERDHRSAGQRRAEALTAVCAASAAQDAAHRAPGGAPTALHVTISLADLLAHFCEDSEPDGYGRVMVSRAQAAILAPGIVRWLACQADVIPVVLGSDGEVLDLGRAVRLFTSAQRRALWHRDGGCTYPGCDMPAAWSDAHHLVHWVDGGESALGNAALLCQRHHTWVHERRLIAAVHPPDDDGHSVTWDLTPGSYDSALPARRAALARPKLDLSRSRRSDPWRDLPPEHLVCAWAEDALRDLDTEADAQAQGDARGEAEGDWPHCASPFGLTA